MVDKDNKNVMRKFIFGGTEEEAIDLCKILAQEQYNIYDIWSGFGYYLFKNRCDNEEKSKMVAAELQEMLDGNKEETHRVWIILQAVMKWLAGEASDEFKEKVEKG